MNKKVKNLIVTIILLFISVIYTIIVKFVDVGKIGPVNSSVGLSHINKFFYSYIGSNNIIYDITKYLGYIILLIPFIYALIGIIQLIKRKSLKKVDKELFITALFYILLLSTYLLFEKVIINYRPVLMDGILEASFPSSHTILAICVCGSALIINNALFKKTKLTKFVSILLILLTFITTIGRFLSGVHWFTDIIGGLIISLFLIQLFRYLLLIINYKHILNIKKQIIFLIIFLLISTISTFALINIKNIYPNLINEIKYNKDGIPLPQKTDGIRGELGIDKNVNELTIDNYLGRDDAVYRDMRMLIDDAEYEKIGGNRFLNGYVDGFEIVPLPYIIPVNNLPEEVGNTYSGKTLFKKNDDGTYKAEYEESLSIINELFPKDKYIFLMCGGGGYAGMMKEFLVSMGWNADKIWVVGGYWYYEGKNNIKLPKLDYGYDTTNVPYHEIDFESLTKIRVKKNKQIELSKRYYDSLTNDKYDNLIYEVNNDYEEYIKLAGSYINKITKNKESFVLVFHDYVDSCSDELMLNDLSYEIMNKYNVYFYAVDPDIYKNTDFYERYRFIPGIIIIKKGKVYKYIDGNNSLTKEIYDEPKYDDKVKKLENWLLKYVSL